MLGQDPFAVEPTAIQNIPVKAVYVGGDACTGHKEPAPQLAIRAGLCYNWRDMKASNGSRVRMRKEPHHGKGCCFNSGAQKL